MSVERGEIGNKLHYFHSWIFKVRNVEYRLSFYTKLPLGAGMKKGSEGVKLEFMDSYFTFFIINSLLSNIEYIFLWNKDRLKTIKPSFSTSILWMLK